MEILENQFLSKVFHIEIRARLLGPHVDYVIFSEFSAGSFLNQEHLLIHLGQKHCREAAPHALNLNVKIKFNVNKTSDPTVFRQLTGCYSQTQMPIFVQAKKRLEEVYLVKKLP